LQLASDVARVGKCHCEILQVAELMTHQRARAVVSTLLFA